MFVDFLSDTRTYLEEKCGVTVDDEILVHLLWADDMIIVSNSANGLQSSLDNLFKYCSQWQLILNVMKTKILVYNKAAIKTRMPPFTFNGSDIEIVSEYKYLGCVFKDLLSMFKEHLNYILTKACKATYQIQKYCAPLGAAPPALCIKLFKSIVMPVIEYGSEVWSAGMNTDALDNYQVKFLKRLLKLN